MKGALESEHGPSNVNVVISNVAPSKGEAKWEGISFLNNFAFSDAGVQAWRAYHIGPGQMSTSGMTLKNYQRVIG